MCGLQIVIRDVAMGSRESAPLFTPQMPEFSVAYHAINRNEVKVPIRMISYQKSADGRDDAIVPIRIATALLDRLLHRAVVVRVEGSSDQLP
ncbi:hypothetical protein AGR7A_Lc10049 [Agrobacterium deltaense NCPPB 1641]|uniref:Uncharacterized protein n=1 Tax=Agrobacterium deltaense NCPPB 1641 TaxID=1183425 RepID=A0A1S7TRW1_9HYPH|nr:hypothetical protein AGR7A_Lc10049 [Agrobacterium deltaense NCPPB 1641]